jgi:hypothetical protein
LGGSRFEQREENSDRKERTKTEYAFHNKTSTEPPAERVRLGR